MVKFGLLVRLDAKPGLESEVESFLQNALPLIQEELNTLVWFAIRLGESSFGIFDAFPDQTSRQDHLAGKVAATLMERAPELFAKPPIIENLDILAVKLP